uniref:Uncharacterized protein n=1 Tax=Chromera velia CCMP2878 TaxID=1169474 RepID=A0A0G4HAW5_9ALVE|eukprot:Cvel_25779.t1-p1 / transcript=Cvel_25779.t1 / gene=Cvel_25779 / organism=Chromera_velia_CCMP2878 / gene_product=hypothetical protein / transcript_product=hypothetical protein / location=Cvel_scaffold2971:6302-12270(-) / protein_length=468 / sequence_SO=supercontig / SO=protein_coding / is_pseudo=false
MVLFRHPLHHYGKVEEEWKPGEVVKVISPTLFRIRPIRERDRGYESYEVDLFVMAIQPMPEKLQQELRKPGGVLENEPLAAEKEKEKRKRSDGKKFIIWKDEKAKQLFLGEVKEKKRGRVTVQHYGSYGKRALRDRLYRPAVRRKGEKAVMFTNNTKKYGAVEPDLFEVEREDIVIEDAEVKKNGRLDGLKELNLDMIGKGFDLGGKLGDLFGSKDAKDDKLGKKAPVCSDFFPTATECGAAIVEGWVPITDSDSIECVVDKDTKMCNPKVCCDPTCATVSNDTCAAWAPRAGFFQAPGAEELCCAPDRETQLCEPSDRCCAPGEMDGQNILDTFPETCASFQRGFGFRLREFRQENPNAEQSLYLFRGTAEAPTSSGATERIGYSPPFEDSYPAPVDINTTYTVAIDPATGLSTPTFTSSFTGGNNVFMFTDNDVPITEAQNGSPPIETDFNACELAVEVAVAQTIP